MRKRNCRLEVCFTKDELSALTKKARKAHLSLGGFVRSAVSGAEIKEAPGADIPKLIYEVRRVGINIDQILKIAHTKGLLMCRSSARLWEDNRAVERMIVTLTRPREADGGHFYLAHQGARG